MQGDQPGPPDGGPKYYPAGGPNPALLFSLDAGVTVGDIRSISFDTKNGGESQNWFVDLLTKPGTGSDDATWYGTNLDFTVGGLSQSAAPGGFTRHSFNSDAGLVNRDPGDRENGDEGPGPFDYAQMIETFGPEEILYVAVGTGTNYDGFEALFDNFRFEYSLDSETHLSVVDFEAQPVPVPAALPMLFGGLAALGVVARRRRG